MGLFRLVRVLIDNIPAPRIYPAQSRDNDTRLGTTAVLWPFEAD